MPVAAPNDYYAVQLIVERLLRSYHAPLFAEVVGVDADQRLAGTADIRPLHYFPREVRGDGDVLERPDIEPTVIPNVVVLVPGCAASDACLYLADRDFGLYIPTMWSLDELIGVDVTGPVQPKDPNQQQLHHGFFIPFVTNRTLSAGASNADRAILGDSVIVGDPATAKALAFKDSMSSAINGIYVELGKISTAISGLGGVYPAPAAPTVQGTAHLKGS